MIARAAAIVLLVLCLAGAWGPAGAAAGPTRASLTDLESQVMCVTCGVPLSIAESPQAEQERAYIRDLINRGESDAEIKRTLVAQLGPGVLALPPRRGFNLAVYLVPVALILVLSGMLAVALPRWRRRGPGGDDAADAHPLSAGEEARLDQELARHRS